jgi:hypothetical protein
MPRKTQRSSGDNDIAGRGKTHETLTLFWAIFLESADSVCSKIVLQKRRVVPGRHFNRDDTSRSFYRA